MGTNSTHWNGTRSCIVVNGLINSEVGIGDRVTKEVRSIDIGVILGEEIIVLGCIILLVGLGHFFQVGYPLRLYVV